MLKQLDNFIFSTHIHYWSSCSNFTVTIISVQDLKSFTSTCRFTLYKSHSASHTMLKSQLCIVIHTSTKCVFKNELDKEIDDIIVAASFTYSLCVELTLPTLKKQFSLHWRVNDKWEGDFCFTVFFVDASLNLFSFWGYSDLFRPIKAI